MTNSIDDSLRQAGALLDDAEAAVKRYRNRAAALAREIVPGLDDEAFRAFHGKPYVLIRKKADEWYCVVPRFVDFAVGWLEFATESFNVFLVNRFTLWLGDVPAEIRKATGIETPPGEMSVLDGDLRFDRESKEAAMKYRRHLSKVGGTSGRIIKGREFDLLADMIADGYLPFAPRPVAEGDRRTPQLVGVSEDAKYQFQRDARADFMRLGAVGVYWMTGAGKSFFTMDVLDSLVGPKLLVVPTVTLVEQWHDYFREHAPRLLDEVTVITYAAYEKAKDREWVITAFDECHRLPANSFSRLATIRTKYRIGLSASPYREDGRTSYIFALTGHPIGMDWRSLMRILGKEYHAVNVWVVPEQQSKMAKLEQLMDRNVKTMVFCDGLDFGNRIAAKFGVTFIHGDTTDRMAKAREARVFVASRVFDMGASLKDLEHLIEVDFLAGSRQQEVQRTGRLLHSLKGRRHDIIMTREEFDSHGKRLHALVERGFKVNVHA